MNYLQKTLLFISLTTLIGYNLSAQAVTDAHKDSLNSILKNYYDLNLKMFQAGSTKADIDKAFALFTEDFTYEHAKYDGYYTRESLYKSALRNQEEGRYDGSVTGFKMVNKIIGLKGAAVQKRFVTKSNGKTTESEPQLSLFEFKKGKISRIVEYW